MNVLLTHSSSILKFSRPFLRGNRKSIKTVVCCLSLILSFFTCAAQNPVSYPKDKKLSNPELNFEVFWRTFEDNYAFFTLRKIDWQRAYSVNRLKINATTSDDSLYNVLCQMLAPFEDNHINLIVPGIKQFKSTKPSQFVNEFPTDSLRTAFRSMVDTDLEHNGFQPMQYKGPKFRNQPLFAWTVSRNLGYLRFNRCFVEADAEGEPDARIASLILDSIFLNFKDLKGLIVDVRDNVGGNDQFSYELASRFAVKKTLGTSVRTRIRGGKYEQLGPAVKTYIAPKEQLNFHGPVVVLTNDKTVSAGDVFAVLMTELPKTTIIGSNTRGIYSDMYGFTLPNGWQVSLSNQRYYNNEGICFEGSGTPVDVKVMNTKADLSSGVDPVLRRAFKELSK